MVTQRREVVAPSRSTFADLKIVTSRRNKKTELQEAALILCLNSTSRTTFCLATPLRVEQHSFIHLSTRVPPARAG